MADKTTAPWNSQQIDALNKTQRAGFIHEFTCPESHEGSDRTLVATVNGWICPHCDYTQNWAHDFMFEEPVDPFAGIRSDKNGERT